MLPEERDNACERFVLVPSLAGERAGMVPRGRPSAAEDTSSAAVRAKRRREIAARRRREKMLVRWSFYFTELSSVFTEENW